jgi:hypothetical protein
MRVTLQQRRLADTWLPAHDQRPALTGAHRVQEPVQHVAFAAPAPELPSGPPQAAG